MRRKRFYSNSSLSSTEESTLTKRKDTDKRRSRSISSSSSSSSKYAPKIKNKKSSSMKNDKYSRSPSPSKSRSKYGEKSRSSKHDHKKKTRSKTKSRSKSPSPHSKFDDYESTLPKRLEKNFDFNEGINDLYKNESSRRHEISKLKSENETEGGFVPKQFKSSRSTQNQSKIINQKEKIDNLHENAIFGNTSCFLTGSEAKTSIIFSKEIQINDETIAKKEVKIPKDSVLHENFYEDMGIRKERWVNKLGEFIESFSSSEYNNS